MRDLNSVLFEGTVTGLACVVDENGEERCSFAVSSPWLQYNSSGELVRSYKTRVRVVIFSGALTKAAVKNACNGCGVRVIGRLVGTAEDNSICIVAERIEYRPVKEV
jgi:hypothetical protein